MLTCLTLHLVQRAVTHLGLDVLLDDDLSLGQRAPCLVDCGDAAQHTDIAPPWSCSCRCREPLPYTSHEPMQLYPLQSCLTCGSCQQLTAH